MTALDRILACLRWDAAGDAALAGLDAAGWSALATELGRAGLLGLLGRRLQRPGAKVTAPPSVAAAIRDAAMATAARALAGSAVLADCLRQTGVEALLLKGIDLGPRYWGGPGHRRMLDLDLLVRPEEVAALDAALRARGYAATASAAAVGLPGEHHLCYRPPGGAGLAIEVHWRLARRVGGGIDLDAIRRRSLPAGLAGVAARVMAAEDLVPYLCAHMAHHLFWTSPVQVWDLAEVMAAEPGLDWDGVAARAREWGIGGAPGLALALLRATLHPPAAGPDAMVPAAVVPEALVAAARAQVARHVDGLPSLVGDGRLLDVMAGERTAAARLALFRRSVLPRPAEVAARLGLPPGSPRVLAGYGRLWRELLARRGATLWRFLGRDRAFESDLRQMAGLRRWVDGPG